MSQSRDKWRRIADQLAVELADHAFCEHHAESNPGDDCPFCRNRSVYLAYVKAGGTDTRILVEQLKGRSVTLAELAADSQDLGEIT